MHVTLSLMPPSNQTTLCRTTDSLAFREFKPEDSSRRSQSGQEGLDDGRDTEEDQERCGLKERGGAF